MRIKLDENITVEAKGPLVAAGHDVDTVVDEQLAGPVARIDSTER